MYINLAEHCHSSNLLCILSDEITGKKTLKLKS